MLFTHREVPLLYLFPARNLFFTAVEIHSNPTSTYKEAEQIRCHTRDEFLFVTRRNRLRWGALNGSTKKNDVRRACFETDTWSTWSHRSFDKLRSFPWRFPCVSSLRNSNKPIFSRLNVNQNGDNASTCSNILLKIISWLQPFKASHSSLKAPEGECECKQAGRVKLLYAAAIKARREIKRRIKHERRKISFFQFGEM